MSKNKKSIFLAGLSAIVIATFLVVAIIYAWTEPTASPPGGNVPAPLNVGTDTQTKQGPLALNASGTSPTGLIVNRDAIFLNGNVGIGTPGPEATLDVGGSMKLLPMAAQPFACAAAKKGALYFNSGTNKHMMCNGAAWVDYTGPQDLPAQRAQQEQRVQLALLVREVPQDLPVQRAPRD